MAALAESPEIQLLTHLLEKRLLLLRQRNLPGQGDGPRPRFRFARWTHLRPFPLETMFVKRVLAEEMHNRQLQRQRAARTSSTIDEDRPTWTAGENVSTIVYETEPDLERRSEIDRSTSAQS